MPCSLAYPSAALKRSPGSPQCTNPNLAERPSKRPLLDQESAESDQKDKNGQNDQNEEQKEGTKISREEKGIVGFATVAIHAGNHPERWDMNQVGKEISGKLLLSLISSKVVPPISLSTTYKQEMPGVPKGHDYSRAGGCMW